MPAATLARDVPLYSATGARALEAAGSRLAACTVFTTGMSRCAELDDLAAVRGASLLEPVVARPDGAQTVHQVLLEVLEGIGRVTVDSKAADMQQRAASSS